MDHNLASAKCRRSRSYKSQVIWQVSQFVHQLFPTFNSTSTSSKHKKYTSWEFFKLHFLNFGVSVALERCEAPRFPSKRACCHLKHIKWLDKKLAGVIGMTGKTISLRIDLYSQCVSYSFLFFSLKRGAGLILSGCQGRQCACQADMTRSTITNRAGKGLPFFFLFHNLTLHVSRGVSSRGRVFSQS